MTDLPKRFGWWWRDPVTALRGVFPNKSEEAIRKYVWPELEKRAFNYELASRHNGRRKYLLRKPFPQLTQQQMSELRRLWPRSPRPLQALRVWGDGEPLSEEERWIASHDRLANKRLRWTAPQFFTMNLEECGDTAIVKAFQKHVALERQRLNIPAPKRNKGRANRRARGLSFRRIEALDVWTTFERQKAETTEYRFDDAQARSARREAERLFSQWTEEKG